VLRRHFLQNHDITVLDPSDEPRLKSYRKRLGFDGLLVEKLSKAVNDTSRTGEKPPANLAGNSST